MNEFLDKLKSSGIHLRVEGEQLRVVAPKGALTDELRQALIANKGKLLALLSATAGGDELPLFIPRLDLRHQPFDLTDVQHAYWMGRNDYVELGGFSTHFYIELERPGLDIDLAERSLRQVIDRHDMLRAVIDADGRQRILPTVPPYRIERDDLRGKPPAERDAELGALRQRMSHNKLPADRWPLFEIRAAQLEEGRLRLFVSLDMLIIDASSMFMFFEDWQRFYENPAWSPAPFKLSYRDYAEFEQTLRDQPAFQRAQDYWTRRLDTLPAAPALPLAMQPRALKDVKFSRRAELVPAAAWQALKARAQRHGATPSVLLMTAFSETLRAWSKEPDFTLNVTMFNRFQIHPEVNQLLGDFTTTSLLAVHAKPAESFVDRLLRVQAQLAEDLDHRQYSGMRVLRDRARRMGNAPGAAMPIVFTSTLALSSQERTVRGFEFFGDYVHGVSQTPQVWLDHQMIEQDGQLHLFWDAIDALFPEGMLDDMFSSYVHLLARLHEDEGAWTRADALDVLPQWQERLLAEVNATGTGWPERSLHGPVVEQALRTPDAPAVIAPDRVLTHGELHRHAARLGRCLRRAGAAVNTLVGVCMDKGWEQVVAIHGVLHSGAAYLPIDPSLPQQRRSQLVRLAGVRTIVTQAHLRDRLAWPDGVHLMVLDDDEVLKESDAPLEVLQAPGDLAYVLFTSGSTGEPKGVMIEHRSAANTLQDINRRFKAGPSDRVLALSAAHFDLSVYDLFGVLAEGGAIVVPAASRQHDPAHWTELVHEHRVTLWNSVPQLLQLWTEHLREHKAGCSTLRWTILSGDWIPVALPEQVRVVCPQVQVLASGGPTETSIWCTQYLVEQVDPQWKSIPYGRPLANQSMHVLNALLEPRAVWAVGEICIGGAAVGRGYLNDAEQTARKFVVHPRTGERLYRSGDLGRTLPDGNIEFLGREDFQVKVNGYRIELGDIEAALREQHGVKEAVVVAAPHPHSGKKQLVAYVVGSDGEADPSVLSEQLACRLPDYMVPQSIVCIDRLPLSGNGKVDRAALPSPWMEGDAPVARVAPRNDIERRLFSIWRELLGHERFGVEDNFFALGLDSVTMIRMVTQINAEFGLSGVSQADILRRIFEGPTIAQLAQAMPQWMDAVTPAGAGSLPVEPMPLVVPDKENLHEPFPALDLQTAYLAGEQAHMEFHVRPNYYVELTYDGFRDAVRFEQALNEALYRQRNNISVFTEDMQLQIVREYTPIRFQAVHDLRGVPEEVADIEFDAIRSGLERKAMPLARWPWVEFRICYRKDRTLLLVNIANHFFDAVSVIALLAEVEHFYSHPGEPLPALELSYRDCVLAYQALERSSLGQESERYWRQRIPQLPEPPPVPRAAGVNPFSRARLVRRDVVFPASVWSAFKSKATRHGLTPAFAIYGLYAEMLSFWSGSRHFLLGNMTTHRPGVRHPQVQDVLGCFATVYPMEIDWRKAAPFAQRLRGLQAGMTMDAQQRHWGGGRIWQAMNQEKRTPGRAPSPFVVVSALDLPPLERPFRGCLETPQVLFDHQFWNLADGGLWLVLDMNDKFLPDGLPEAFWNAYQAFFKRLAEDDSAWSKTHFDLLPASQAVQRRSVNDTTEPISQELLHGSLAAATARHPHKPAVISSTGTLSYAELLQRSRQLGHCLRQGGVRPKELVAILLDKGWEQVVAAFGILASGAAYVPIDPEWPDERIRYVLRNTNARFVVSGSHERVRRAVPSDVEVVCVEAAFLDGFSDEPLPAVQAPTDLAYVIFTSGSTGEPKGVMIDHRGALNTILDVNRKFGIGETDVLFGSSALTFDLSVHDLFGSVAAGATLVLPQATASPDPVEWMQTVERHGVTVWNSVPALMQLLVDAARASGTLLPSLKTVMLSGDWIPVSLPGQIRQVAPQARQYSLGGATEASIWSIYHPIESVDPAWSSIPYGKPLANQSWHVLDDNGHDAPDWVPGHLYIGGIGLALGYWADSEKTQRAFVRHPRTGERLYRTGDLGRYLPDGNIEFLGRADLQVKVQGYRIELGEIDHALLQHPGVEAAVVVAQGELSRRQLVAFVVLKQGSTCEAEEVRAHLRARLPAYMVPAQLVFLDELPLTGNGKVDRGALAQHVPDAHTDKTPSVPPRTPVEAELVRIWEEVLAVAPIGIRDDFFELGGQSFAAIQVMTRIAQRYGRRLPLGALMEGRTVESLAHAVQVAVTWSPLVPIKVQGEGRPVFLIHPAGGNVLCYGPLARHVRRPVYGLQAPGLSGEQPPVDDIEKMAALYMRSIREVQPHGPYVLGGWSSGGLVAFEVARQFEEQGEKVERVLLLDSPAPLLHGAIDRGTALLWFIRDLDPGVDLSGLAADDVEGMSLAELLDLLERRQGVRHGLAAEHLEPVFEVFCAALRGGRSYKPLPIRADIVVVKVRENRVDEFFGHPAIHDPHWGWSAFTHGALHAEEVDGDHYTVLSPVNLPRLAALLCGQSNLVECEA